MCGEWARAPGDGDIGTGWGRRGTCSKDAAMNIVLVLLRTLDLWGAVRVMEIFKSESDISDFSHRTALLAMAWPRE